LRGWLRCKTQLALAPDFGGWIPKKTRIRMGGQGFSEARDLEGSLVSDKPNWTIGYGTLLFNVPAAGIGGNMISTKNGDVTYIFSHQQRMGIIRPLQKSSSIFCESKLYILKYILG